ncbi:MAG: hypothetical protein HRT74_06925 [Flavobacteriales bacterium]|nr:hypothetical protein [Flavobacteriales bacterium]
MDFEFERDWQNTLKTLEGKFGGGLALDGILLLIGVQELGQGPRKFKKDEKIQLFHIAICTLLQKYGYYEFIGRDEDDWPHFKRVLELPSLDAKDQEIMIKKAVIDYMETAF